MPPLANVKASNASYAPSYIPTAVFIGATSGIGQAMAELLARKLDGRVNIFIVGRNKAAADEIFAGLPAPNGGAYEFVHCDASELKNVHETSQLLLARLEKINFLVLTLNANAFSAVPTSEGLERGMVLRYYARAKFLEELLPLLQKAHDKGEDAKVMSVLSAGMGTKVDMNDLGLKKKWSMMRMTLQASTYTDIMVKVQSERHQDIAFMHISPGAVDTPSNRNLHWIINMLHPILKHFVYTPADSGENMMYALLRPEFATGGYWLGSQADKKKLPGHVTDDIATKVWDHTLEVIRVQ